MKSIKANFLYNSAYQILLIILPLITTPYISRVLGADGIGAYSYTNTMAGYFLLFAMLGVKNYGNRCTAAVREDRAALSRTFREIYGLQFLCSLAVMILYLGYVLVFADNYRLVALIQGIYVLSGLLDISWLFFGLEEFKITVTRNIAIRLIDLACIFLFVREPGDLWKYTLIMTLGVLVSQAYLWLYLPRFVDRCRPRMKEMLSHLKGELILFVPVIAVSLYKMMDKVMLGQLSTVTQVGFYECTEKVVNLPLGVISALGTVMLPRMSNLAAKGEHEKSRAYIRQSMTFAMLMASAMCFGIAGVAEELIPLFLGEGYESCILLLQMLSPTVLFIAWANVIRTQYLIPNQKDKSYLISVSLGAGVNLVINFILIPRYAAMGAVIGTICAEAAVCICQTVMVRRELEIGRYLRDCLPFLLIGAGMLIPVRLVAGLSGHPLILLAEIAAGAAFYIAAGLLWLIRVRDPLVLSLTEALRKKCRQSD